MRTYLWLVVCFLISANPLHSFAQPSTRLCTDTAPLQIEWEVDYRDLTRGKYDDYRPALVRITLPDGSVDSGRMPLKPRGHFRQDYCHFPPLKLDFGAAGFTHPMLIDLPKLKLVSHCRDSKSFYQYVFLEYHIYQAYQLFTPMSLGVRMAEVTYRDQRGKLAPFTRMAFLIEDIDDLAERNGCFEFEPEQALPSYLDAQQLGLMSMFQLMIGNLDWYVGNLHNLKLIRRSDPADATIYPVPYDFDYCGLINARYAVPPERMPVQSVRDRCYLGPCPAVADIEAQRLAFLAHRDEVLAIFRASPYLDSYHRSEALAYLESFFELLERPKHLAHLITATCPMAR